MNVASVAAPMLITAPVAESHGSTSSGSLRLDFSNVLAAFRDEGPIAETVPTKKVARHEQLSKTSLKEQKSRDAVTSKVPDTVPFHSATAVDPVREPVQLPALGPIALRLGDAAGPEGATFQALALGSEEPARTGRKIWEAGKDMTVGSARGNESIGTANSDRSELQSADKQAPQVGYSGPIAFAVEFDGSSQISSVAAAKDLTRESQPAIVATSSVKAGERIQSQLAVSDRVRDDRTQVPPEAQLSVSADVTGRDESSFQVIEQLTTLQGGAEASIARRSASSLPPSGPTQQATDAGATLLSNGTLSQADEQVGTRRSLAESDPRPGYSSGTPRPELHGNTTESDEKLSGKNASEQPNGLQKCANEQAKLSPAAAQSDPTRAPLAGFSAQPTNSPSSANRAAEVGAPAASITESKSETNATLQPPPTRDISIRVGGVGSPNVDLRVVEKGGKVQVTVKTPDPELARSLQSDLGDLVGRLEKKGYQAETWTPQSSPAEAVSGSGQSNGAAGDRSSQQQQQDPRQGSGHGQPADEREKNRTRWRDEFETSTSLPVFQSGEYYDQQY